MKSMQVNLQRFPVYHACSKCQAADFLCILSLLFLQTDLYLEVGVLDNFVRCCPWPILAQELSRSKWTMWQSQTTCFTGFLLISWSKCLQPSFPCFCASHSIWWLPVVQVKTHHTSLPGSPPLSSNVGSPHGSGHDLDGMGTRSRSTTDEKLDALLSKFVHFETQIAQILLSRLRCPVWIHISRKHLEISRVDLQRWNTISVPSLHVCARSRHMLPLHQMYPVRHDPGLQLNRLTAPQPQGPMAQGHLRTTETHDEGFTLPQAQKMNNHEVPSYFDSLANNTSKELQSGSIPFGRSPICWHVTNLSEFIAKQVPCQSGLFLKHEANAKTLFFDIRMMVFLMQLTVPSAAPTQLSQCVNPDQLKTGRLENNLCRCGKSWLTSLKFSLLMEMTKVLSSFHRSMLAHKSSASKIEETALENRFSNMLHLVVDKRLPLLHLICLFLVFRLRCCTGFSLKPTGLMCDGRPSPPRFFAAWRVEAFFFVFFLVSMGSWTVFYLTNVRKYQGQSDREWKLGLSIESASRAWHSSVCTTGRQFGKQTQAARNTVAARSNHWLRKASYLVPSEAPWNCVSLKTNYLNNAIVTCRISHTRTTATPRTTRSSTTGADTSINSRTSHHSVNGVAWVAKELHINQYMSAGSETLRSSWRISFCSTGSDGEHATTFSNGRDSEKRSVQNPQRTLQDQKTRKKCPQYELFHQLRCKRGLLQSLSILSQELDVQCRLWSLFVKKWDCLCLQEEHDSKAPRVLDIQASIGVTVSEVQAKI